MKALIALVTLTMVAAPVAAADLLAEDRVVRVIVHSQDAALKDQLGVVYDWPHYGSFASNIPESVYEALLVAGVDVFLDIPRRIAVLEEDFTRIQAGVDAPGLDCHGGPPPHTGCGGGGTRAVPSDQTPYGIQQIYNNDAITSTSGGAGKKLGHLDTGILNTHLDLVNRIVGCESTVNNDASCVDGNGHGTHTAGTASADAGSDKLGIYGVAPEASIFTIKVCGKSGFCTISDSIEAIDRCIAVGCNVITFSIGGNSGDSSERSAIQRFNTAGGRFIAAAGNDGDGLCTIDYPGSFKESVSVASIDVTKSVNSWSSRGCTVDSNSFDEDGEVDFAAAGYQVESAWKDGKYNVISGTSMATPHVSGLALKKGSTNSALLQGVEDITKNYGSNTETKATVGIDLASGNGLPHV